MANSGSSAAPEGIAEAIAAHRVRSGHSVTLDRCATGQVDLSLRLRDDRTAGGAEDFLAFAVLAVHCAGLSALSDGARLTMIDISANIQAMELGSTWLAKARVTRLGRTIVSLRAEIFAAARDGSTTGPLALVQATLRRS